jgi:UDP-N-acetylmuramate-alanine ligase
VWWLRDAERAERALAPRLGEGDLLVTLGAGDIFKLAEALVEEGE